MSASLASDERPVLFVTGHAPAYRVGALASLHDHEGIELALFGGRLRHGGPPVAGALPFPHRAVRPRELFALAASGRYRAVVCPTGGRLAPLATWLGARRARAPLILWASLWAHPRTAAHAVSYAGLRRLYRSADAVVTYGPHVSAYVRAGGARNVFVAPQSVDNAFWRAPAHDEQIAAAWPPGAQTRFLFVGRADAEKGLAVLLDAWRVLHAGALERPGHEHPGPALALALAGETDGRQGRRGAAGNAGVVCLGALAPRALRSAYAAAHVLVVPSIPTRTFREPWGLVVNEAMNQRVAVIATDAVGAAAGGLVRDGQNGLIVPAGEGPALARAMARLAGAPELRARMAEAGARDVLAYDHDAWARGFSDALGSLGLSRGRW